MLVFPSIDIIILCHVPLIFLFFFFNDTATTEIYTLSLHDALPIYRCDSARSRRNARGGPGRAGRRRRNRSEEHTSELQSHSDLVCRLLLEKKKNASSLGYPTTPS